MIQVLCFRRNVALFQFLVQQSLYIVVVVVLSSLLPGPATPEFLTVALLDPTPQLTTTNPVFYVRTVFQYSYSTPRGWLHVRVMLLFLKKKKKKVVD